MKQSRFLPFGRNQVRPPKGGSAAESLEEVASAAEGCFRKLDFRICHAHSAAESAAEG